VKERKRNNCVNRGHYVCHAACLQCHPGSACTSLIPKIIDYLYSLHHFFTFCKLHTYIVTHSGFGIIHLYTSLHITMLWIYKYYSVFLKKPENWQIEENTFNYKQATTKIKIKASSISSKYFQMSECKGNCEYSYKSVWSV
jgi:hypothetical protein